MTLQIKTLQHKGISMASNKVLQHVTVLLAAKYISCFLGNCKGWFSLVHKHQQQTRLKVLLLSFRNFPSKAVAINSLLHQHMLLMLMCYWKPALTLLLLHLSLQILNHKPGNLITLVENIAKLNLAWPWIYECCTLGCLLTI